MDDLTKLREQKPGDMQVDLGNYNSMVRATRANQNLTFNQDQFHVTGDISGRQVELLMSSVLNMLGMSSFFPYKRLGANSFRFKEGYWQIESRLDMYRGEQTVELNTGQQFVELRWNRRATTFTLQSHSTRRVSDDNNVYVTRVRFDYADGRHKIGHIYRFGDERRDTPY